VSILANIDPASACDMAPTPVYASCYQPLPPHYTRVLELHAGDLSDPLVGHLIIQPIDGEPYEAVSYVWGGGPTKYMTVDGAAIRIKSSLKSALQTFRRSRGAGRTRRLWVDSVCINQDDISERTSQVVMMDLIFAGASRVLCWLGSDEDGLMNFAMEVIRDFLKDPDAALHQARVLLHVDDPADHHTLGEEDQEQCLREAQRWAAIKAFFDTEYFHRTWIVQELGLAREAKMICSNKRQSLVAHEATPGRHALRRLDSAHTPDHELELRSITWPLVRDFVRYIGFNGASLETHLDLKCWVAAHISFVWDTNKDGSPACDFPTALHWVRIMRVTDPRDRIFSLLGHPLAIMNGEMVVKPDYTVSRGTVYTRLAASLIRNTNKLYILTLVDHESDESMKYLDWDASDDARMPSWVPDWHSINRTTPLPYPNTPAPCEDDKILIQGSLDNVTGQLMSHLLVHGWIADKVEAISHMMETTDFPVTNLSRESTKKNPFYLSRLWELAYPSQESHNRDPIEVLDHLSLALAGGLHDNHAQELAEGDDHSSKNATLPGKAQDIHRRSFARYMLDYHELLEDTTARVPPSEVGSVFSTAASLRTPSKILPPSSLYASLPEFAQTKVQHRAANASSLQFVQDITWIAMCRVIFRTSTGLIGMGPRVMQPGDLICRVRGSPVLMVLREISRGHSSDGPPEMHCMHVGPCIVPERMVSGKADGSEFGEIEKDFVLH
jgi:hypothetical protein